MKKLWIEFLSLVFLITGGYLLYSYPNLYYPNKQPQKKSAAAPVFVTVTQIITTPSQGSILQKVTIQEGSTAFDVLKKTSLIKTAGEGKYIFITEINGQKASDDMREFWSFYVNGKLLPQDAGKYKIKNMDTIEWKIETY